MGYNVLPKENVLSYCEQLFHFHSLILILLHAMLEFYHSHSAQPVL